MPSLGRRGAVEGQREAPGPLSAWEQRMSQAGPAGDEQEDDAIQRAMDDGDVPDTVARGREGVRNTSGITWMSPPGATGGSGEARGVPHLGPAPLE